MASVEAIGASDVSPRTRALAAAGPLMANLAAAVILRVLVPTTLVASGERFRYYTMSSLFPFRDCPSFHCFRVLPPLLAGLIPGNRMDGFILAGMAFQILAGVMLWYIAERLHGSRRIAALATAWFWVTWGPIQSFNDPLLIADPAQMFWSLSALYLLLSGHYLLALPVLVSGAAVKESVLLIPMIYALYAYLSGDDARRRPIWLAVLIAAPLAAWLLLRFVLSSRYGYVAHEDAAYVRATYLFGTWLPNLGTWPRNVVIALLYTFGACGAAWIIGPLGLSMANRRQRALTIASLAPMVFIALFQVPDRGLATFPYALLIPAACFVSRLPTPLTIALLALNAAFSIRMNAAVPWLPRTPLILVALLCTTGVAVWIGRRRADPAATVAEPLTRADAQRIDWPAWSASGVIVALCVAVGATQASRIASASVAHVAHWAPDSFGSARPIDDDRGIPAVAVSPDGHWVAFVGARAGAEDASNRAIWLRRVDGTGAEEVGGTVGANAPFWSPDSRAIGFFADGKLKTVDVAGGTSRTLADAPFPHGGAWSPRGVIVFAPDALGGLLQVPEAGGAASAATEVDEARGDWWHRWPSFLPDGDQFLFAVKGATRSASGAYLARLTSGGAARITGLAVRSLYADGHVFVSYGGRLDQQYFDDRRQSVFGDRRRVGRAVTDAESASGAFDVAANTLITADPSEAARRPAEAQTRRVDRAGRVLARLGPATDFQGPVVPADLAIRLPPRAVPTSWSPDRQVLLYHAPAARSWDAWAITASDSTPPVRLIVGDGVQHVQAQFSPDGKWIAYVSRLADDVAVYLEAYPSTGRKWRVSTDGGSQPRWRGDGREIVYVSGDRSFRSVAFDPQPEPRLGPPRPLFAARLRPESAAGFRFEYDMTPGGEEFLVNAVLVQPPAAFTLVTNWKAWLFR